MPRPALPRRASHSAKSAVFCAQRAARTGLVCASREAITAHEAQRLRSLGAHGVQRHLRAVGCCMRLQTTSLHCWRAHCADASARVFTRTFSARQARTRFPEAITMLRSRFLASLDACASVDHIGSLRVRDSRCLRHEVRRSTTRAVCHAVDRYADVRVLRALTRATGAAINRLHGGRGLVFWGD